MGGKNGIVLASHPACTFQPPETQQEQHLRFQAYPAPVIPPKKTAIQIIDVHFIHISLGLS